MGLCIFSLVVAGACAGVAGFAAQEDADSGAVGKFFFFLAAAVFLGVLGGIGLYYSGAGNPSSLIVMPNEIYSFDGQIATSKGDVAVVENSRGDVFAVWSKTDNKESFEGIPEETRFVKIGEIEGKTCLIPADAPEEKKSQGAHR